jgi:acetyltransferase-like isoleucine patch superfamily enzyme
MYMERIACSAPTVPSVGIGGDPAAAKGNPSVYVHPSSICETAALGDGTRVWAFCHLMDGAVVGRHCNIGDHVFVESGVRIGDRVTIKNGAMLFKGVTLEDDVFIGPGVVFTNDRFPRSPRMAEAAERYASERSWLAATTVRRGAAIGARAVIVPGLTIAAYATVAAGSVVTRNVSEHRLVVGNPARDMGWVCLCGLRLPESLHCTSCGRRYRRHEGSLRRSD